MRNLDGLVNDEVVPYVIEGRLPSYLKAEDVRYIIDFPGMLEPKVGVTHGFDSAQLKACVRPLSAIGDELDPSARWAGDVIRLYAVDQTCVG